MPHKKILVQNFILIYLSFSIFRIAGINYGEDHEEIEYMVNGPRDEHRLPLQELLSQMVTDVATGNKKRQ